MKAAVYCRVSTSDQSTDLQIREISEYVTKRGWEFEIYEDAGLTGTNGNRPALKRLLADVKSRKVDVVVCWKLDRLFRSLKDLISTLQEFEDVNVKFISLKDQIDMTTASGKLLMHLLGAFGEFEASLIRERVRAGLKAAKAKGKRLGRPRKIDRKQVAKLRQEGRSLNDIAQKLRVSKGAISKVLTSLREQETILV
jgi:DNA invertase Pin-like site-specific DNA recombinase